MDIPDWFIPVLLLFAGVATAVLCWKSRRSHQILRSWAESSGFKILSSRNCWFWRGPFFLRSSADQAVFRVTVKDSTGKTRTGWIRCGSYWFGLFHDTTVVRWDDEPGR